MFAFMDCNSNDITLRLPSYVVMQILETMYKNKEFRDLYSSVEIASRKNQVFHKQIENFYKKLDKNNFI